MTTGVAVMTDVLRPGREEALAEWARRVRANRDQAERVRQGGPAPDFYAPVSSMFKADPHRSDEPVLDALRTLVRQGETWLDIGAGGGRYALPLALLAREVIAVEPSDSMLGVLRDGMAEHAIDNVRVVQSTWPPQDAVAADVALISHVGYDIEEIGPFLDAMDASARRLCAAVLVSGSPAAIAAPFWPAVHGEEREQLPGLDEFLVLQLARGRLCEVRLFERGAMTYADGEAPLSWLHQQLFIQSGGEKSQTLAAAVSRQLSSRDGRWAISWDPVPLGLVTWRPS